MTFGISPTDIITAIHLIVLIKKNWFDKANRADAIYREFVDDIAHLSNSLDKLKAAFTTAYEASERDPSCLDPTNEAVDKDRRAIIGDIKATLEACQTLLEQHAAMGRGGVSFIQNTSFHLEVLPKIKDLRERLKLHMIKMIFVLEPLQHGLLKSTYENTQILVDVVGDISAHLIRGVPVAEFQYPSLSPPFKAKLEDAFSKDQPSGVSNGRFVELVFDALHRIFLASTVTYHGPAFGTQTQQQYLNLRTAQFLLERLQADDGLSERFYFDRAIRKLEYQVRSEYRRRQITQYPDDVLEKLPIQIWRPSGPPEKTQFPKRVESGVPAQEILGIPLLPDGGEPFERLVVSRQDKDDYHKFSLIRKAPATATSDAWNDRFPFNIRDHAYVPWNALPKHAAPLNGVEIRARESDESVLLRFENSEDTLKFQHAIMGFRVVCDKAGFTWFFNKASVGENRDPRQNRIQLWVPESRGPRKKRKHSGRQDSSTVSSGSRSVTASSVTTTVQSFSSLSNETFGEQSTIATSIEPESKTVGRQETTSIRALPGPVLFLFTVLDKKYTFIHVELTRHHHLHYQCKCLQCKCRKKKHRCECPDKKHQCTSVAVKCTKGEFPFRTYSVETNQTAEWDLAQFANPQHPKFHKLRKQKTSYLDLYFSSMQDRIDFAGHFNDLIEKHRENQKDNINSSNQHKNRSDRPRDLTSEKDAWLDPSTPPSSQRLSWSQTRSSLSLSSSPPRLKPLHHGAAGIKNVPAAPAAVKLGPTSISSHTVVDWTETKSRVATVLLSKEVAYSSQEELFANVLYKANFALLCQICQTSNLHCHLSTSSKRDLGHVRDRMCLWGDALGDGRLEACLSAQDELHKSLISLLDRIGKTLVTVVEQSISIRECKKTKWSLVKGLRELLSKAASILSVDEPSSSICESDSDSASENDDDESQDKVAAGIRSLQVYSKLLMDLCPTLEQAFYTRQAGAGGNEPASGFKSFEVTESALPWVGQVYEKFRTADNGLLERLGEANWQRFVRIRALISDSATAQESFEEPKTIFKPLTVHTFRDSALGASIPAQSEVAGSVASHTSFMSSVEGEGRMHLAVPRTPQEILRNEPFTCSFCGTLLKTLRNRIDWKMHIFSDLQAYICTFNDCHERLKTFSTRTLWSRHELEAHFSDKSFRCRDCHESSVTFTDQESYLDHLSRVHGREALTHVHALSMAQAAAQSVPRSFTDQECPLCAQTGWKSHREYFTHLGKHLERISLAALPQEEDESEDDSDQGDEENFTFKCICGFDDDDGSIVLDERCDTWQHIACYYENHSQVLEEHLCVDCSPRTLDILGASRRQKEIRRKAPVNPETALFQDATSAPYIGPSSSPSLRALLQDEWLTLPDNGTISRVKGETEDTWLLDESKRQQVNDENLLNDAQQLLKKGQHNPTRDASQSYPPQNGLPPYQRPFSPPQELGPMQREPQNPPLHHLLDDAHNDRPSSTKQHKCPYCSLDFTDIKSHLLTHSHEKPYVCQTCQSTFRRLHDLKRHTKLHTGEFPHICRQCGRKFARIDALARHQKGPGGCPRTRSSPRSDTSPLPGLENYAKQSGEHGDGASSFNFENAGASADNEFTLPDLGTSTFDDFLNDNTD